jgi:hypothetical protein
LSLGTEFRFELPNGAEHMKQQTPGGIAGIDVLIEDVQVDALALEFLGKLAQMPGGACQAVEARHHERIAFPDIF